MSKKQKIWSTFAIVGFILCFVFGPLGLAFSIAGVCHCNMYGYKGKGLAIAGILLGSLATIMLPFIW